MVHLGASPRLQDEETILQELVDELSDFYDQQEARLWLFSQQKLLGGQTPAQLIQQGHVEEVRRVIAQLRDGVFV
jgi:uncharacterized protein (DUF2384 family)